MTEPDDQTIDDDRLRALYHYWQRQAGGRAMPARRDIDPADIPSLLPHLILTDVLAGGRYRFRLIGTEISAAQGIQATGRYLDEVLQGEDYRAYVLGLYDELVQRRRPLYTDSFFLSLRDGAAERHTKRLMLPLSADGVRVDMVLVGQLFFFIDQATRHRHFIDARPFRETTHIIL